jgi:hypothetical protein
MVRILWSLFSGAQAMGNISAMRFINTALLTRVEPWPLKDFDHATRTYRAAMTEISHMVCFTGLRRLTFLGVRVGFAEPGTAAPAAAGYSPSHPFRKERAARMKQEDSSVNKAQPQMSLWWAEPSPLVAAQAALRLFTLLIDALRSARRKASRASTTVHAEPDHQHHA